MYVKNQKKIFIYDKNFLNEINKKYIFMNINENLMKMKSNDNVLCMYNDIRRKN